MSPMRSKDVADLAGVSVRTLRHYHQIGVLPEPDRDSNNYRNYTLAHVAALLRIRRLVDLGVNLDRITAFFDDETDCGDAQLDAVDRELAARIQQLQEQRILIARVRAEPQRPDLPSGTDSFAAFVTSAGGDLATFERDASLVLARLTGDTHEADLRRLGTALQQADRAGALTGVLHRFQNLAAGAPTTEVKALAEDFIELLGTHLVDFLESASGQSIGRANPSQVPEIHGDPRLNEAQATALQVVADLLDVLTAHRSTRT